jgi:hypothetical protein
VHFYCGTGLLPDGSNFVEGVIKGTSNPYWVWADGVTEGQEPFVEAEGLGKLI